MPEPTHPLRRFAGVGISYVVALGFEVSGIESPFWGRVLWGIAVVWTIWLVSTSGPFWRYLPLGPRRVEIRVASPANQAREEELEWIHMEAEPTRRRSVARNARISVWIAGEFFDLRWQTDDGPKEEWTLQHGSPQAIPFVVRSSEGGYLRGVHLDGGTTYLVDTEFFRKKSVTTLEANKGHRIKAVVEHEGGKSTEHFELSIPRPGVGRLTLTRTLGQLAGKVGGNA